MKRWSAAPQHEHRRLLCICGALGDDPPADVKYQYPAGFQSGGADRIRRPEYHLCHLCASVWQCQSECLQHQRESSAGLSHVTAGNCADIRQGRSHCSASPSPVGWVEPLFLRASTPTKRSTGFVMLKRILRTIGTMAISSRQANGARSICQTL